MSCSLSTDAHLHFNLGQQHRTWKLTPPAELYQLPVYKQVPQVRTSGHQQRMRHSVGVCGLCQVPGHNSVQCRPSTAAVGCTRCASTGSPFSVTPVLQHHILEGLFSSGANWVSRT